MTKTNVKEDAGLAARGAALDMLVAVLNNGISLDDALAGHQELGRLAPRDRAFARMLVATTLRRLGQIDALIAQCLDRPLAKKAEVVRHILRLGTCQLLFMRTPPHAAVDAAVRLAVARKQMHMKGLVNAVLRRLSRDGAEMMAPQDAARLNTPDWLWQSWTDAYGAEVCRAIAAAHFGRAAAGLFRHDRCRALGDRARRSPLADRHRPASAWRTGCRPAGIRIGRLVDPGRRRRPAGAASGRRCDGGAWAIGM